MKILLLCCIYILSVANAEFSWKDDGLKGEVKVQVWQTYKSNTKNGKVVKGDSTHEKGEIRYDKEGLRIEKFYHAGDGRFGSRSGRTTYHYQNGKIASIKYYRGENYTEFNGKKIYTYNDKGQKVRVQDQNSDGKISPVYELFSYDENGFLLSESIAIDKKSDANVHFSGITSKYYEYRNARLVIAISYCKTVNPCEAKRYDKDGLLNTAKHYHGSTLSSRRYWYDKERHPIKEQNTIFNETTADIARNRIPNYVYVFEEREANIREKYTLTYTYTFDSLGNMLTKITFKNGEPLWFTEYAIEYYGQ